MLTNADRNPKAVPPNAEIIWMPVGSHSHPVCVFRYASVLIYPLVQAQRHGDQGNLLEVVTRLSKMLIQDDLVGLLPLFGHDFHFAYAIAQDWARALRSKEVDPADWASIAAWAEAYNSRTEWGTTLIRERLDPRNITPPDHGATP